MRALPLTSLALLAWGCGSTKPQTAYPPYQRQSIADSSLIEDAAGQKEMFYVYDIAAISDTVFTSLIYQGSVKGRHVFRVPGEMSWETELTYRILIDGKQCRVENPRSLREEAIQFGRSPRKPEKSEGSCLVKDPLVY